MLFFCKGIFDWKKEQSLIFLICYEFIRISRSFRYSSKTIKSLPLFVTESFSRGSQQIIDEFSVLVQETLYYIAGWTIHAASKTSWRRREDIRHCLNFFVNSVSIMDSDSEIMQLANRTSGSTHSFGWTAILDIIILYFYVSYQNYLLRHTIWRV